MKDEQNCTACQRMRVRDDAEIKRLMNRLSRIEGQIRGIRGMVEKHAYCPDILIQSTAAAAALDSFNRELLGGHVRSCVAEDLRQGREETVDELLDILQRLMR